MTMAQVSDFDTASSIRQQQRPQRLAYSVLEAAEASGLGRTTIYGLIQQGRLPSRKIGKRRIIAAADLERLINEGSAN